MKKGNPRKSLMPAALDTKPALYVYRDDGTGHPDGTHVKKFDHAPTIEELNAGLPAGLYVLLHSERGNMHRKRIIIEGAPGSPDAPAPRSRDPLEILSRAVEMKALASALRDDGPDPLEQLAKVQAILGGRGDVGLFKDGLALGRNLDGEDDQVESPELALTRDIMDRLGPAAGGGGSARQWKEIAVTLARRISALESRTERILRAIEAREKGAPEMRRSPEAHMNETEIHEQVNQLVKQLAADLPDGPESLRTVLNVQNAQSAGALKRALKMSTPMEREIVLTKLLAERVDLIDTYRQTVENFLKD